MCFPCWPFTDVYLEETERPRRRKKKVEGVMMYDPMFRRWVKVNSASAQNFQPQVGDTTKGPTEHTYIARSDGTILINGIVYLPQPTTTAAPAVAAIPVPVPVPAPAPMPGCFPGDAAPYPAFPYYSPYAMQPMQPMQPPFPNYPYPMAPQSAFGGGGPFVPPGAGYVPQPAIGTFGATPIEIQMQQMQTSDAFKKQDMKPADDDPFRMYWVREQDNTWSQRNRLTIDSGDIGDCRWYVTREGVFYAVRLAS